MLRFIRWILNFRAHKKQQLLVILLGFLITFFLARAVSIYFSPAIYYHGYHIHHFYFGMITLSVGGFLAVLSYNPKARYYASGLIGIGIGLFADEIGLLLNCTTPTRECTYLFPDFFDVIIWIAGVIAFMMIFFDLLDEYHRRKNGVKK